MEKNINPHFYFDGDLIINFHGVPQKSFKVHRNVLEGFPVLTLHESPEHVEDLLSFIYPASYLSIKWENISYMLSLAIKYVIKGLKEACEEFLDRYQYNFPTAFKKSSKLVLEIQGITRNKFQNRYIDFVTAVGKLPILSKSLPAFTGNDVKTIFQQRVNEILKSAGIKPSELRASLLDPHLERGYSYVAFRPEQISQHSGQFENLNAHFGENSDAFYIFVELSSN
ncbi:hypothetical protein G9A89_002020 [Geosiphon pyriformis]|nr:hypothetical protein G9A89_002020 [Geosiphon pyriformis]